MPLPMPRFVISSPIHMSSTVPAVRETMMSTISPEPAFERALAAEEERVPGRLRGREDDREVARVLRDLRVARLALPLQLAEPRDDDGHQLEDDRRRDVRHDPEREQGELRERASREEVEQAEDRAAAAREVVLDRLRVDARRGDPRAEPVDGEHRGREEHALAELRNPPGVREPREHLVSAQDQNPRVRILVARRSLKASASRPLCLWLSLSRLLSWSSSSAASGSAASGSASLVGLDLAARRRGR